MADEIIGFLKNLRAEDFVTSKDAIRAGFLAMALDKNAVSIPYLKEARVLHALAKQARTARDLVSMESVRRGLITAAGLSDKAVSHLEADVQEKLLLDLVENILEPEGENFADELVYRFLLIRGDSMGGRIRNLIGRQGDERFLRMVISALSLAGHEFWWRTGKSAKWNKGNPDEPGIEQRARSLYWSASGKDRLLMLNLNFPIVEDSNVDIALFEGTMADYAKSRNAIVQQYTRVLALGELKGGIDPAGADEHWKTANHALNRIRSGFAENGANPKLCFIAAAVSERMGREIHKRIKSKILSYAANLTNDDQLAMICAWLVRL